MRKFADETRLRGYVPEPDHRMTLNALAFA